MNKAIDKKFFWIITILLIVGVVTFVSASLPLYTQNKGAFWVELFKHIGLGAGGGFLFMLLISKIPYLFWKKYALIIFLTTLGLTLLVFSPLGVGHGGAQRWVSFKIISFQPSELLKFGAVIFLSAWFDKYKESVKTFRHGLAAFLGILAPVIFILFFQPHFGMIALISIALFVIYFLRGANLKHILVFALIVVAGGILYASTQPYAMQRVTSFFNQEKDPLGSGYQVRQSKIAIGSGELLGRGLGQSIQKFDNYLPEHSSDFIFAVFAEELGFVGGVLLIMLYLAFAFFGFRIAKNAPNAFAQNLTVGIITIIIIQSFFNIAAVSGLFFVSGLPLVFISSGGTVLLTTLGALGIVLNISRYKKTNLVKKRII
ncbi:MAG: putative peptidoglycan glycosyltransferase FtsW [Candidatus Pacebacteria bacterium]|nr:putative peptidoglycan glycosyltransferase FtsW [Candidatus Paceibacterota bacterium]